MDNQLLQKKSLFNNVKKDSSMTKKIIKLLVALLLSWSNGIFAQDFTIGVIPDWQKLTYLPPDGLQQMRNITQWFADHKQELNIVFVASLGDMSQGTFNETTYSAEQWWRNTASLKTLRDNGIPFSPNQGNHDPYTAIHTYFPVSDFENDSYWGGSMNGLIENAWYKFDVSGMKFMLLTTQWEQSSIVNNWANSIFKENSDKRAIFVNHSGLSNAPGGNDYLVDPIVRQNDNIFLATMGHLSGNEYFKTTSIGGNTQHIIRTDYQDWEGRQDQALIRYYVFKPNKDSVYAYTYNLRTRSYETSPDCEFSFYYAMEDSPLVSVTGLSVSPANVTLYTESKQEMIPVALPLNATSRSVSWESNNPTVATVNSRGIVSAIASGTATITATTSDGGFTATSVVTIVPAIVNYVTGITVLWPVVNLKAGDKQQLNLTFSPTNATNKSVSWSSSDESVAIVSSSGLVTALAVGTAIITIAALDGSEVTATSVVTVAPGTVIYVTKATVMWPEISLKAGHTQQLYATVSPANATYKSVSWTSNNISVATVSSNGLVTAIAAGTATITVAALDGSGITATSKVTATDDVTATHDLKTIPDEQSVSIYPNPLNQDKLTIKMDNNGGLENVEVIITNLQGQKVYQNSVYGNKTVEISTSGLLKSSIYIVSVKYGQSIITKKIVVQ